MNKKILVVTEQYFPFGSAMAGRIVSFCKLFKESKHDVYVISLHSEGNIDINKKNIYEGIEYEVLSSKDRTSVETFVGDSIFISRIKEYFENNYVDIVFAVSVHIKYTELYKLCKKYNKPLIIEQCEWYDSSSYKFGKLDPRYIRFTNNIKNNYIKADGVISISRYLDNYYLSKGANSIRIPSIFDVKNTRIIESYPSNKIKLMYGGNTSKSKDMILPIIEALSLKGEYKEKIQFDIYGASKSKLKKSLNEKGYLLDELSDIVFVHGYVSREEFVEALGSADYQIFIKPYRRSSDACFPTKLAESMAYGTPVIANNTGDISLFLHDGENGYICDDCTSVSIEKTLLRIIDLSRSDYLKLREKARKTAESSFDYRIYIEKTENFINNI